MSENFHEAQSRNSFLVLTLAQFISWDNKIFVKMSVNFSITFR